ncbi:MAG: hypothetical protein IPK63_11510 [Candidatus Competibacteraceae bacterium]|nr:hypothetical protein [Candidatus Competibacteraceae bacterium]
MRATCAARGASSVFAIDPPPIGSRCSAISTGRPTVYEGLGLGLDSARQARLTEDLTALLERLNVGGPHSLVVPSEYFEVVITKKSDL